MYDTVHTRFPPEPNGYLLKEKIPTDKVKEINISYVRRKKKNGEKYSYIKYGKRAQEYVARVFPQLKEKIDEDHGGKYVSQNSDYVKGEFHGEVISFKRVFDGHSFTDEEAEKLLNGEEIEYEDTEKGGTVKGHLQERTNPETGRHYIGFTPDWSKEYKK